jgi:CheY-like chemotaxis protein
MEPESATSTSLWLQGGITCVLVSAPIGYDVELRNPSGVAFLRKSAATVDAARNEAEYLRLLLDTDSFAPAIADLKPFALIVEDDSDSCDAYTEALKSINVRAMGVGTGTEGVRLAKALTPDLIVVDYRLPDITGAEVCRRLREDPITEPVPMIAITGMPDALREDGCVADAILTKPCRLDTFLAAARLFLRSTVGA